MINANLKYEVLHGLNSIVEKSKANVVSYHSKLVIYWILEITSYLVFLMLLIIAFFVPTSIEVYLGSLNDKQLDRMVFFKIFFLFLSVFPLGVGLLINSSRRKSKKMYDIFKIASGLISKLVAEGNV
jgi:hypothetical protein